MPPRPTRRRRVVDRVPQGSVPGHRGTVPRGPRVDPRFVIGVGAQQCLVVEVQAVRARPRPENCGEADFPVDKGSIAVEAQRLVIRQLPAPSPRSRANSGDSVHNVEIARAAPSREPTNCGVALAPVPIESGLPGVELQHNGTTSGQVSLQRLGCAAPNQVTTACPR